MEKTMCIQGLGPMKVRHVTLARFGSKVRDAEHSLGMRFGSGTRLGCWIRSPQKTCTMRWNANTRAGLPTVFSPRVSSNTFIEVTIPHQKNSNEAHFFPKVVSPNPTTTTHNPSLAELTDSIKSHKPWLESLLHNAGAILLRGFPVLTPSDFNEVVESFGFDELPYEGSAAPRTKVFGRVFTANESPPDQNIPFHHEMCLVPEFPSKLFLFCEIAPGSGGETPIVLSHIVYERMKERHPEFVQRLEEQGLIYTRVFREEDESSPLGRGWNSIFLTKDKKVAEERAAKLGMRLDWMEDGVKTVMGPLPAIKYDETRQRNIWFNSMVIAYIEWKSEMLTFGDGEPLQADIINDCIKILDEESVAFPWQKSDVLLLDNLAVLHSRRPCSTPRRVLISLCK